MSRFKKIAASSLTAVALAATAVTAPTATAADADSWQENVNPDFQPGEAGGSSTGSSQLDLTLIITAAAVGVTALASAVALYSPNVDLEKAARDAGLNQIADQIAAIQATLPGLPASPPNSRKVVQHGTSF